MPTKIGFIFWGLILVLLDLNINQFDILPDFIGYILVAIGCHGLISASRQFATARNASWVLVLWTLVDLILPGGIKEVLTVIASIINCIMMWFLMGGFMDISHSINRPDFADKASIRRLFYVFLSLAGSVLTFCAILMRSIAASALILLFIGIPGIVVYIMILYLIYQIKGGVENRENGRFNEEDHRFV